MEKNERYVKNACKKRNRAYLCTRSERMQAFIGS
jgi:hypothetical protein